MNVQSLSSANRMAEVDGMLNIEEANTEEIESTVNNNHRYHLYFIHIFYFIHR